jgi:light-regulated signal transduction histidine kinase (bacteriophytochrome)
VELVREIGERRQAEQALLEQRRALTRSNADLEQFAYVASHDLQEPLRMVASYVQLLSKRYRGQLDDQADKYIGYAVEGTTRMQALIAGLLDYSRVGREVTPVRVSAEAALEQGLRNLKPVLDESGAVVSSGPLPDVVADAGQLVQVFQNLLGNAVKFRLPGVAARVRVSAVKQGHECVFAVTDNGIGIEPGQADRIFVIFQRLHTRTEYPGTGMGLAICKKIVERLGGRIWVESTPGDGATFLFSLPASDGEQP